MPKNGLFHRGRPRIGVGWAKDDSKFRGHLGIRTQDFGAEAAVLEPEKLKEMVREDLYSTLAEYQAGCIAFNLVRESRAI